MPQHGRGSTLLRSGHTTSVQHHDPGIRCGGHWRQVRDLQEESYRNPWRVVTGPAVGSHARSPERNRGIVGQCRYLVERLARVSSIRPMKKKKENTWGRFRPEWLRLL